MQKETKFLLRLPINLKKEFKLACVQNDITMSDAIRELMIDYIKKNKKT